MTQAMLLAMVAATLGAPRLDVYRSLAVPWVGAKVTYQAAVVGAQPNETWHVSMSTSGPSGRMALLDGAIVTIGPKGTARAEASTKFGKAGWHRLAATATGPGGAKLRASLNIPVTSQRVDFAWYQAEKGHELRNVTMQLTCPEKETDYWRKRGVITARWCGAMCGADKPLEHFVTGWGSHKAVAIDEFGGSPQACEKFTQGLLKVRQMRPHEFIAVWFAGEFRYWQRLRDAVDVFMPEIYLNYGAYNLHRFDPILARARQDGVFGKLLMGIGINVVKDKQGRVTNRPTPREIVDEVIYLKRKAPDLRGLAVFAYGSAEPAVRAALDEAMGKYWLRPVLDVAEAKVTPDVAAPGRKATIEATVRNAGFMPEAGAEVQALYGGKVVAHWPIAIDAQKSTKLRAEFVPGATGVVSFKIVAPTGVTVLAPRVDAPVARVAGRADVAYARAPKGLPVWVTGAQARAMRALDSKGMEPAQVIDGPDGARLVWLADGTDSFWEASKTAPTAKAPRVERKDDQITVVAGQTAYVLDAGKDELTSIKWGPKALEILKSPWRMNWDDWQGFGVAKVDDGPVAAVVTVPVDNDVLSGATKYAFFRTGVEITRWFKPKTDHLDVTNASEGCQLDQRPGSFACQMGLGSRPQCGRLQVGSKYRDLYFGQISLSPDQADKAGWLDFAWDAPYGVGLGVAAEQKWRTEGSKPGYDLTRFYDAADWIQVAEVSGQRTSVGAEWSRVYLLPHGPADLSKGADRSLARSLREEVSSPARLLRRG